ncbi:MAG TPA: response regulator transcription factor [bacterium]|nr:response regulator transcription factor [bacterium]
MRPLVLHIDKDETFRKHFKDHFPEYDVQSAPDGKTALKILSLPNNIAIVVFALAAAWQEEMQNIKKIKFLHNNLPVIILSECGSKELLIEALRARADDYLDKPLDCEKGREICARLLASMKGLIGSEKMTVKGKIEKVKLFLLANVFKKTGLADAARTVSWSPKYLSRVFPAITGKGFEDYRLELKMEQAKRLLRETHESVEGISRKLGYAYPESFRRQFKELTGATPTKFRKRTESAGYGR